MATTLPEPDTSDIRWAPTGWRQFMPPPRRLDVTDLELAVLIVCTLVTTVGLGGDIARHLQNPGDLEGDFLSGWHLVLYGGVASVGALGNASPAGSAGSPCSHQPAGGRRRGEARFAVTTTGRAWVLRPIARPKPALDRPTAPTRPPTPGIRRRTAVRAVTRALSARPKADGSASPLVTGGPSPGTRDG